MPSLVLVLAPIGVGARIMQITEALSGKDLSFFIYLHFILRSCPGRTFPFYYIFAQTFPFTRDYYIYRFGMGVGNGEKKYVL